MANQRKRLEKALRGCAEAGVPDTMDLWPAVKERATGERVSAEPAGQEGGRAAPRRWPRFPHLVPNTPLGWVLAAVSVLILGFGVYAAAEPVREFYRQGLPGTVETGSDKEPVRNLGTRPDENLSALRTELDQTKTADGVRVTLDWAYADERFVAVNLNTEEHDDAQKPGESSSGSDAVVLEPSLWDDTVGDEAEIPPYVKITDQSGQDFDLVGGGTGLGPRLTAAEAVFDAPEGVELARGHRFRLEVPLQEAPQRVGQKLSGKPEPGPFVFDFKVPVHPAPTIELNQEVETDGVSLTLERVVASPLLPQAVVCFEPPDDRYSWMPWLKDNGYYEEVSSAPQKLGDGCWSLEMDAQVEGRSFVAVETLESVPGSSSDPDEPLVPKVIRGPWTFEFDAPER